MRATFTANMHMDVDDEASSAAVPRQPSSGMVLRACVRHVKAADLAPAASVVTHDHVDLAAASHGVPPNSAHGAREHLASHRLPRDLRVLGWSILHVALYSGVFFTRVNLRHATASMCCSSTACSAAGTYETMQHLFLECPDVAAASDWLVRLWVAVSPMGSAAPPHSAAVLLAEDDHVWQPDGSEEHRQLWTILRLCFLQAVWCLHCQHSLAPERHAVTSATAVAATVAAVQRLMRLDYVRTIGNAHTMTALVPRHIGAHLAASEFLGHWAGHAGTLCSLSLVDASGASSCTCPRRLWSPCSDS